MDRNNKNRIKGQDASGASGSSVELAPAPPALPGGGEAMTEAEFYAAARARVAALLEDLGCDLVAQAHLSTDEYGCIRVEARPILVRRGPRSGV